MRVRRLVLPSAFAAAFAFATLATGPAAAGAFEESTGFGSNPGNLRMFTYVPDDLRDPAPLVVVMHGCNQTASEYLDQSGWREAADAGRFALVLPEQQLGGGPWTFNGRNHPTRCLNFAERRDSIRDGGEALSIRQMVGHAAGRLGADPERVFVTGLSAGGGMTAVMLATYPDVFAAGAVVAGLPYRCGEATLTAPAACGVTLQGQTPNRAPDRSPADWGGRVRAAAPAGFAGPWPRVSIWQGEADGTVDPPNATELVEQWTNVHGADAVPDSEEQVGPARRAAFDDAAGRTQVELYRIPGFGHATPIDPDAADPCGRAGAFVRDADICSTAAISRFFGLGASPPTVTIDSVGVEGDAIVVAGAAGDADGPLAEVVVRLDGPSPQPARAAVGAESWTARFEALPSDRFYRPVAIAVDSDGETATAAAAPVAVGTPPPNEPPDVAVLEARAEGDCLRVSGSAADPDGIADVVVRLGPRDAVAAALDGEAFTTETCGLPSGSYPIEAVATDTLGAEATAVGPTAEIGDALVVANGTWLDHLIAGRLRFYPSPCPSVGFGTCDTRFVEIHATHGLAAFNLFEDSAQNWFLDPANVP